MSIQLGLTLSANQYIHKPGPTHRGIEVVSCNFTVVKKDLSMYICTTFFFTRLKVGMARSYGQGSQKRLQGPIMREKYHQTPTSITITAALQLIYQTSCADFRSICMLKITPSPTTRKPFLSSFES